MLVDAHSRAGGHGLVDEQTLGSALTEITQHGILTVGNAMDLPSNKRNLDVSEMCNLVLPASVCIPGTVLKQYRSHHARDWVQQQV